MFRDFDAISNWLKNNLNQSLFSCRNSYEESEIQWTNEVVNFHSLGADLFKSNVPVI